MKKNIPAIWNWKESFKSKTMEQNSNNRVFNSVQLNIVLFVDVQKAVASNSLEGAVYIMDTSFQSEREGTANLQTVCKQGQVLNWIIYPLDSEQRPDGSWPPSARIDNIVFLKEQDGDVSAAPVCNHLKIYGGPDRIRSSNTPVYDYWAGDVAPDLSEGVYGYRLILELEREKSSRPLYLNLEDLSLRVIPINPSAPAGKR